MKKIQIKKIVLTLSMLGVASIGQAQWAVMNQNDPIYFGMSGIFTQAMGQMLNSVKASVDQVSAMQDIARKQATQYQQDTDIRNRAALGSAEIAKRNMSIFPTVQCCVELSKISTGAGAMRSASTGGSGGGAGKTTPAGPGSAADLKSESAVQALMINNKTKIDTCSVNDKGVGGCSTTGTAGTYGGSISIPSSDVSALSLKGNTSNSEKKTSDKASQELANFSLSPAAIDVANQYIKNATLYAAPKMLPDAKLQANPAYKSMYDSVMIKLYGAQQAMKDILASRKAPTNDWDTSSAAGKYWSDNKTKYESIFGLTQPAIPSLQDIINFTAANDFMGTPSDTAQSQEEILKDIGRKVSLYNMIASKQLSQQENTNILLSLLLTQQVTPVDVGQLNVQYNNIMNTKN